ncbi:hypothetical protein DPMN_121416 [Dreissena polymorpha]|uniref:Uncharacterized protein n=1 Tax=Dreissena polymorpha TaxID=45954 RepID=A0A9D4GQG4_DREPO|nr:hypothetical protein DPMN_121416 [Dreissena polymorpha]
MPQQSQNLVRRYPTSLSNLKVWSGATRPASAITKSGQELPDQPQQSQSLVRSYPTSLSNHKVWSGATRPASAIIKSGQELPDQPQQSQSLVRVADRVAPDQTECLLF